MFKPELITLIHDATVIQRWNDHIRPWNGFSELDKQAHKMFYAYVLAKCEGDGNYDPLNLVEGGIFEFLHRIVLTDIKPPIYHQLMKEKGDQINRWVLDELKGQLESFIKSNKAVYPQFKGTDLQRFESSKTKDTADIREMRKEVFEVTAQALKIPLPMMLGNITNMNEIVKVYLSICIDPLADMIGEEITRKSYSFAEWKKGCRVKVDTSCINHVDILEAGQDIYNAIGSGAVNVEEMRNRLGLPPINTEFSKQFFVTKNYVPAEEMLNNPNLEGGE